MNNLGLDECKSNDLCELIQKRGNTTTPSETHPKQVWVQGVAISKTEVDMFLNKRSVDFESRQASCCMQTLKHQLAGFKLLDVLFLFSLTLCPPAECQLLEGCSVTWLCFISFNLHTESFSSFIIVFDSICSIYPFLQRQNPSTL